MKRNIIQRIARHIIKDELMENIERNRRTINELNKLKQQYTQLREQIQCEYKKNSELRHEIIELKRINYIIPDYMLCALIQNMPNPNDFAHGCINSHDLFDGEIQTLKWQSRYDKFPREARCRFSKVHKERLEVEFVDIDLKVFIPCKKKQLNYNFIGILTEIDTYVWDFNSIGLAMISAGTFDRIVSIFRGQRSAIEQFNY